MDPAPAFLPPTDTIDQRDLFDIAGKRAVVTGGASGIGLMIARGYLRAGAQVLIASRKEDALRRAVRDLEGEGDIDYLTADLSYEAGCSDLATAVGHRWDSVDIVVNNAGATWGAPIADHGADAWARVLGVNVEGVFHTTRFLVPLLQAAGTVEDPARVINIGSVDGIHSPTMENYSYSASKAAVHQMTRHLARHLAPTITVNAIAPGPFESKMMRQTLESVGDRLAKKLPLRRIGRESDMAGAAIFLSSPAASYITGVVLPVAGGQATAV